MGMINGLSQSPLGILSGLTVAQQADVIEQARAAEISTAKRDAEMYRTSFETANAENKRLSAKLAALQASVDSKDLTIARASERMLSLDAALAKQDQAVIRLQDALHMAEFERDRLFNHPLMRFARWMKGWD